MLTLLILFVHAISGVLCFCNFTSKWTIDNYTLDLSTFQAMGLIISGKDSQYTYRFSPFNNLISSNSYSGQMLHQTVVQTTESPGSNSHIIQYQLNLDDQKNAMPTISFDKYDNIVWTFQYSSNISIEFICDPLISPDSPYMEFTNILEIFSGKFLFEISSSYFCTNNIAPQSLNKQKCIWKVAPYTLNLTNLYEFEILLPGNKKYSVCSDSVYIETTPAPTYHYPNCCMIGFMGNSDNPNQTSLNFWPYSANPVHNITEHSWSFVYAGSYPHLTIKWICNQTVDPYYVVPSEATSVNSVSIQSKYACNEECSFMSSDGKYYLDLHELAGDNIYASDVNLTYTLEYTPCSNGIYCGSYNKYMAIRWDIIRRDCSVHLATFSGNNFDGYNLTYSTSKQRWHFVYYNGQTCSGSQERIFNIYWECNENVASWEVTKIEETYSDCEYSMHIQTKYIC